MMNVSLKKTTKKTSGRSIPWVPFLALLGLALGILWELAPKKIEATSQKTVVSIPQNRCEMVVEVVAPPNGVAIENGKPKITGRLSEKVEIPWGCKATLEKTKGGPYSIVRSDGEIFTSTVIKNKTENREQVGSSFDSFQFGSEGPDEVHIRVRMK